MPVSRNASSEIWGMPPSGGRAEAARAAGACRPASCGKPPVHCAPLWAVHECLEIEELVLRIGGGSGRWG